jgi:hypothetical protein
MKTKIFTLLFCLVALWSCEKQNEIPNDELVISGIISQQGITTYQYGTHTIDCIDSEIYYALESKTINLDDYLSKKVTIKAEKIPGYPLEDGPEYLEVKAIW